MAVFVIAVRGGKRRLIAGGGRQLVPTHFLSWASKKENALQKKEDAKENLLKKVFSGHFPKTEGPRPLRLPRASIFHCTRTAEARAELSALRGGLH